MSRWTGVETYRANGTMVELIDHAINCIPIELWTTNHFDGDTKNWTDCVNNEWIKQIVDMLVCILKNIYQRLTFTHFLLCQTPSMIRENYGDVSWSGMESFPWNDPTAPENAFLAAQHFSVETIEYDPKQVENRWIPPDLRWWSYKKYLWIVCQDESPFNSDPLSTFVGGNTKDLCRNLKTGLSLCYPIIFYNTFAFIPICQPSYI